MALLFCFEQQLTTGYGHVFHTRTATGSHIVKWLNGLAFKVKQSAITGEHKQAAVRLVMKYNYGLVKRPHHLNAFALPLNAVQTTVGKAEINLFAVLCTGNAANGRQPRRNGGN